MSSAETQPHDALAKLRIDRAQEQQPRSRWKRPAALLGVSVLLLGLAAAGFLIAQRSGLVSSPWGWLTVPDAIKRRTEVRIVRATVKSGRSADAVVVATGYLESRRQAKIGARAPGRIEAVHVEEGSRVKDQQVLAVLEHADLDASFAATQAMLAQARAQLAEQDVEIARTEREYQRAESLRKSGGISTSDYDQAKYQYEGAQARRRSVTAAVTLAEARVSEAEQLRENMYIRASFDGTVISKDAEVGESILPGGMGEASGRGSVVTIADLDHLEVECDVKEDYIGRVSAAQLAEVAVDAVPDRRYQGRVRKVIPMGDRARATIKVQVEIIDVDERLFPDMSATVFFLPSAAEHAAESSDERRVFCHSDAIDSDEQGSYVWVVEGDDRTRRADIKAGPARDGQTEIVAGLLGDERVIADAPPGIRSGQLVKAVE